MIFTAEEKKLKRTAERTLRFLKKKRIILQTPLPHIDLFILPHRAMVELKRRAISSLSFWARNRERSKFPNILAFPYDPAFPNPEARGTLGEIYLNASVFQEGFPRAAYLLVHGILHLLHYDHEHKRDMIRMERLEAQVMRHLFVPHDAP